MFADYVLFCFAVVLRVGVAVRLFGVGIPRCCVLICLVFCFSACMVFVLVYLLLTFA